MGFRIEKYKALLAGGFRDALRVQLAGAIKDLDISSRASRAARIHRARKRVKKVRAALRLLQAADFPRASHADHTLLHDACAELAAIRSADANLNALTRLCKQTGSDHLRFPRAFAALEKEKRAVFRTSTAPMHRASTLIKAALARIESWEDGALPWSDVMRGLEKIHRKARRDFRRALENPTAENLHEWRKRSKDLFFTLKLIEEDLPKSARATMKQLKKTGELLGRDHDLSLLMAALDKPGFKRERRILDKLIPERRRNLQRKAFEIGAKCFRGKSSDFLRKIEE